MQKTVIVGLSGGVDSAVSAYLLKEKGYNVIGVFMKNWDDENDDNLCSATEDFEEVKKVAFHLDIPYYSVNFEKEYKDKVFKLFINEYKRGRTPNPDILCNKEIKFKAFLEYAFELGADYVATGHYARIRRNSGENIELLTGIDKNKDQTYFLHQLSEKQLEKIIFPLGELKKPKVRAIAKEINLPNAIRKDSTGICFIGEKDFQKFLTKYIPAKKGEILNFKTKEKIGEHNGVMYYTIGQRKGLGIGGAKERFFVAGKNIKKNQLLVTSGNDDLLWSDSLIANNINIFTKKKEFKCLIKTRYRQKNVSATVKVIKKDEIKVFFDEKIKAVTPGQSVVLYQDDICLGGGVIDKIFREEEELQYLY